MDNKIVAKFNICVEVPFNSYLSKKKNRKAIKEIKEWLTEAVKFSDTIPIWVNNTSIGIPIEDETGKIKVKVFNVNSLNERDSWE